MGNCVASQHTKKSSSSSSFSSSSSSSFTYTATATATENWQSTAKIVHINGKIQELKQPTKANQILSQNPHCFLCSSESMYINRHVPHVPEDEELQLGQIYFLLPLSKSNSLLSLQDLCALAIKASAALDQLESSSKTMPYLHINNNGFCKIPVGLDIVGVNFPAGKGGAGAGAAGAAAHKLIEYFKLIRV